MKAIHTSTADTVFWSSDSAINAENAQGIKIRQTKIVELLMQDIDLSAISSAIKKPVAETALVDDITQVHLDIASLQQSESSSISSSATLMLLQHGKLIYLCQQQCYAM